MSTSKTFAWAAWHPKHGFAQPYSWGGLAFIDIDGACAQVKSLNADDGTTNRTGWRAVKVEIARVMP